MKKINELRDYLLENYVDRHGGLDISGLDFSEFDGDVYINAMKVKGDLYQNSHDVKGDLYQGEQEVQGDLFQENQEVQGDLYQSNHDVDGNLFQSWHEVKGDYYSTNINVSGSITFEKPKKALKEVTVEELEIMGYKLKEEVEE